MPQFCISGTPNTWCFVGGETLSRGTESEYKSLPEMSKYYWYFSPEKEHFLPNWM